MVTSPPIHDYRRGGILPRRQTRSRSEPQPIGHIKRGVETGFIGEGHLLFSARGGGVTFGYITLVYKFCNGSTTVSMLQCIAHILGAGPCLTLFITHSTDGLALPSLNRTLTSSILLTLGIAQTCLALLSLNRKIDITYPLEQCVCKRLVSAYRPLTDRLQTGCPSPIISLKVKKNDTPQKNGNKNGICAPARRFSSIICHYLPPRQKDIVSLHRQNQSTGFGGVL